MAKRRFRSSVHPAGFVNCAEVVLAEQLDESGNTALFVSPEMIMNMPAEVVFAKLLIVFGSTADDVIQSVQAKVFCLAQLGTEPLVVKPTAQRPNSVDKRQVGHCEPGGAQIPDRMRWRAAEKVDRRIADQENRIFPGSQMVR